MIESELLLEWRAATEAATEGEWKCREIGTGFLVDLVVPPGEVESYKQASFEVEADAKLFMTARTAMPELLAEVERLRVQANCDGRHGYFANCDACGWES